MSPYNPQIHHRRSIRLKGYDYSQEGLYFITMVCKDRICQFGEIVEQNMVLNEQGKIVDCEWNRTIAIRPNVKLHDYHMHAIIEKLYRNSPPQNEGFISPKGTVGAIIRGFKGAVLRQTGFSVWQRDYYEHIIRNEADYIRISNYIQNNPCRWDGDKLKIRAL